VGPSGDGRVPGKLALHLSARRNPVHLLPKRFGLRVFHGLHSRGCGLLASQSFHADTGPLPRLPGSFTGFYFLKRFLSPFPRKDFCPHFVLSISVSHVCPVHHPGQFHGEEV